MEWLILLAIAFALGRSHRSNAHEHGGVWHEHPHEGKHTHMINKEGLSDFWIPTDKKGH